MKKYLMWNPDKVCHYLGISDSEQSALTILNKEAGTMGSVSSIFEANDFEHAASIIECIHQETDIRLSWEELPDDLGLFIYRGSEYQDYAKAWAEGAVYQLTYKASLQDMFSNQVLLQAVVSSVTTTEYCINSGQTDIKVVVARISRPDVVFASIDMFLEA